MGTIVSWGILCPKLSADVRVGTREVCGKTSPNIPMCIVATDLQKEVEGL